MSGQSNGYSSICRIWRGWATAANADTYQRIVSTDVIPGIEARRIASFRSISLLRKQVGDDGLVEFTTPMWFDDLDCVRAFVGEDYEWAYVPAAAQAVLRDYDRRAAHRVLLDQRSQDEAR